MLTCALKEITGVDCPGCGIQRAFLKLTEGELVESIKLFPALIPMFILFAFTLVHLKFMFKNGHKIILFVFITSTFLTLLNFSFKLI